MLLHVFIYTLFLFTFFSCFFAVVLYNQSDNFFINFSYKFNKKLESLDAENIKNIVDLMISKTKIGLDI